MTRGVALREVLATDLPIYFKWQSDPEARIMAAFTDENSTDLNAFVERWTKNISDAANITQTILVNGQVAGNIVSYMLADEREVGYWVDKAYWGKGIATEALTQFLASVRIRPLYARAVDDNAASIRVLEKCGFMKIGTDRGFANARGEEVTEVLMKLDADATDEAP